MHKSGRRDVLKTIGGAAVGLTAPAVIRSANAAPPFFKLYMMIPNNQPARMIWGTLAAQQMSKLGIDVVSSYVRFPSHRFAPHQGRRQDPSGWRLGLISGTLLLQLDHAAAELAVHAAT